MKYMYTAVISPSEDGAKFYARVPDIPGCITTGNSLDDAIVQITDALNGCLVVAEDMGLDIAAPTPQNALPHGPSDVLTLVSADTIAYRAKTDTRAIRKNVSIPAWMAKLADQRGINCSKVLQDALRQALA